MRVKASPENESRSFEVSPADTGSRLDLYVQRCLPQVSRSEISRWIAQGHIRLLTPKGTFVPGPIKPSRRVQTGEQVMVEPPAPVGSALEPWAMPLTIVFQDEHLAVIDKPAGWVTHPGPGHHRETLVHALLHHCRDLSGIGGELRPGIVHRLDKDTSGLLLIAKHDRIHRALSAGIQARQIKRIYQSLAWGAPSAGRFEVKNRLGRDPQDRKRFSVVSQGGKEAESFFVALRIWPELTLFEVSLATGRTHQIRVHCQHLGHPILGDRTYGRRGEAKKCQTLGIPRPDRQMLHAGRLLFRHPITGENMDFSAPLPRDFAEVLELLGKGAENIPI
jgi:23S rRNA pseudouridine1911/1915/1917 synthase